VRTLHERYETVCKGIAFAAEKAGRSIADITLMGVTKTRSLEEILRASTSLGLSLFGENRVQEAIPKISSWPGNIPAEWHLIGHLQKNKARKALLHFSMIQSLDSRALADTLERICCELGKEQVSVLMEVNTSGEATKYGVQPEDAFSLASYICEKCEHLSLKGLMTIGPLTGEERIVRTSFSQLRELSDVIARELDREMPVLSMGMSHDFQWAIEEGSTLVRIGSALFGPREYN